MRCYTFISTDRLRGLLCQACGRRLAAVRHLRRALRHARAGYRRETAWVLFDLASLLLESPRRRCQKRANVLLRSAREVAAATGMGLLVRRIDAAETRPSCPPRSAGV